MLLTLSVALPELQAVQSIVPSVQPTDLSISGFLLYWQFTALGGEEVNTLGVWHPQHVWIWRHSNVSFSFSDSTLD